MVEYKKIRMEDRATTAWSRPNLTILMATYNGADTLPRTLEALTGIDTPAGGWKIVIVDDGSTDDSRAIITRFMGRLPLTLIDGAHGGKNTALNVALSEIDGDLVVFIDDDVLPERDWLVTLREIADREPDYAIFGGAIRPAWEREPASWLRAVVRPGPVWGLIERDEGACYHTLAFGGNMAVRAEVFRRGYRFNEQVGPNGTPLYRIGSETELQYRLHRDGYRTWHCPRAAVRHIISSAEIEESWILRRAERFGRGQSAIGYDVPGRWAFRIAGVPADLIGKMVASRIRASICGLTGRKQGRVQALWDYRFCRGIAHERRRVARENTGRITVSPSDVPAEPEGKSVSVVISNHNYARFVAEAIRSALDQTVPVHEIVVVDDGSTDDSRAVLERFRHESRVHVIYQKNTGQAGAINRGFDACHGDLVLFLDADDRLRPNAVETVLANWQPGASQCQFPLELVDNDGRVRGLHPLSQIVEYGDVHWKLVIAGQYRYMPTSAHVFARRALERILPMPVAEWRLCADTYLVTMSTAFGPVVNLSEPLGLYRLHGQNGWYTETIDGDRMQTIWRQHLQVWRSLAGLLHSTAAACKTPTETARQQFAELFLLRRVVMASLRDADLVSARRFRESCRQGLRAAWHASVGAPQRALYLMFFAAAYSGLGQRSWMRRWMVHPRMRSGSVRRLVDRLKGREFYDWMIVRERPATVHSLEFDRTLLFGIGHTAERYLWYGWERSLVNGNVIVGNVAALIGIVPDASRAIEVTLDVNPRLAAAVTSQRLDVFANGVKVYGADLSGPKKIMFTVPKTALDIGDALVLSFRCPDFLVPRLLDEKSRDTKPQAFMVKSMRFHQVATSVSAGHPCLPVGRPVDLSDKSAAGILDAGWHHPTTDGVRMARRYAAIRFSILRGGASDHIVTLSFEPERRRGLRRSMVRVLFGDIVLGSVDLVKDTQISVLVPTALDSQYWVNNPYGIEEGHGKVTLTVAADDLFPAGDVAGSVEVAAEGPCLRRIALDRASLPPGVPQIVSGQPIDMTSGGDGGRYLDSGWQSADQYGTFTADVCGRLRGVLISDRRDIALTAIVAPPANGGPYQRQELALVCNGMRLARYRVSERSEVTALIPESLIGEDRQVELEFRTNVVGRPADLGVGSDTRVLGINLESLTLE